MTLLIFCLGITVAVFTVLNLHSSWSFSAEASFCWQHTADAARDSVRKWEAVQVDERCAWSVEFRRSTIEFYRETARRHAEYARTNASRIPRVFRESYLAMARKPGEAKIRKMLEQETP